MSAAWTICKRELAGAFGQPLAPVVLTSFLLLVALLTLGLDDLLSADVASMRRSFFWIGACFVFLAPAVSMRGLAEERRAGTLQLLLTLPVRPWAVVVGKWAGATGLLTVALALTFTWPLALALRGPLDWGPVLGGYLGLWCMGAAFCAIGTATSAWTRSQGVAFLLATALCLVPWLFGFALPLFPARWVGLLQTLTVEYHFDNLARGVLDLRSLVFFASVIAVALRAAVLSLEHGRLAR